MSMRELTQFEHVLLGVICRGAASGYDLKRTLATSPLGAYQPSSGALYPALRRLERRGMLRPRRSSGRASVRPRRVLVATALGRGEHRRWIRQPVDPQTVGRDLRLHLMRFVMMEGQLPDEETLAFLHSLRAALTHFVVELDRYRASAQLPGRHPRLALDHGAAIHRASLEWVARTIAELDEPDGSIGVPRAEPPTAIASDPQAALTADAGISP
jgi:DNA-binding PadR family transcriptional regulator